MKRSKSYNINGNLEEIIDVFTDLNRFGDAHPLIYKVEQLNAIEGDDLYKVFEKPFSWIPININYKARVIRSDKTTVEYRVTGIPFLKVHFLYNYSEDSLDHIVINLHIELNGYLPIKGLILNKMIKAQDVIMHSISR
jgi:hypothetical protein